MCIRRGRSRRSWRIISAVSSAATRAGGNKEQEETYAGEIKAAPNITKASSTDLLKIKNQNIDNVQMMFL